MPFRGVGTDVGTCEPTHLHGADKWKQINGNTKIPSEGRVCFRDTLNLSASDESDEMEKKYVYCCCNYWLVKGVVQHFGDWFHWVSYHKLSEKIDTTIVCVPCT